MGPGMDAPAVVSDDGPPFDGARDVPLTRAPGGPA